MITGAHVIIYSKHPEGDRAFFRDIFKFSSVDAGRSWLIFALPPAEAAFHPAEKNDVRELYFMCDEPQGDDGIAEGEESEVSPGAGGTLGKSDHSHTSRRRPYWFVPAQASDGDWPLKD